MNDDTFEHKGYTFRVKVEYDENDPPWEWTDGHGPVTDWVRRAKHPGEWVLCSDHGSSRYYNFQEAMETAKIDGWDAPPYGVGTKGERALRAVTADYEWLRKWCSGDWCYVTLHVILLKEDEDGDTVETEFEEYLGCVEYDYSQNGHWMECAKEMADELIRQFEQALEDERTLAQIENRFRDAMECGV